MMAISLWQPWATLWLLRDPDEKVFETRHWYTGYRGELLVHAAKKQDGDVRAALRDPYFQERLGAHGLTILDLSFGALIGSVRLVGCCRMDKMPPQSEREQMAGNWSPDRYAWERGRTTATFKTPIPYKGQQGFFDVPYSVLTCCWLASPQQPNGMMIPVGDSKLF